MNATNWGDMGVEGRTQGGGLRLHTIVWLRWLAVFGQTATVALVYWGFGFDLPITPILLCIAASAWLNVALRLRYPASHRLSNAHASMMLAYDILQLAALIYLTGGLANPFAFLMLAPVSVSASTLPTRMTILLAALAVVCATLLAVFHLALPWYASETFTVSSTYLLGVWAALICGIVFIGHYAWRIAAEARRMSDALTATELVLAREQRLSALDGLAAAAAHELGTPLGTIAVISKELLRDAAPDDPHRDDLELLRSQAERCRQILGNLAGHAQKPDAVLSRVRLTDLLEEVATPHRVFDVGIVVGCAGDGPEPVVARNTALLYGLGNLVENAVDYADTRVDIAAAWTRGGVDVTIEDDGPGIPRDVLEHIGEPFVTTRPASGGAEGGDGHIGMGLGFFIAKTLLERSGARLDIENRAAPERGARVRIHWPAGRLGAVPLDQRDDAGAGAQGALTPVSP
jgi:two-component system sensor histidine kinase RegB